MNYQRRVILLGLVDAAIVNAAVTLAYLLRFEFNIDSEYFTWLPYVAFFHMLLIIITFSKFKMYRRILQYASIGELVIIFKATVISECTFYAFSTTTHHLFAEYKVPQSIYPLSWVLIMLGVGGSRFAWRMFRDSYLKSGLRSDRRRTLIIGAGEAGALMVKELKRSPDSELYPVAFVDDDKTKWGLEVLGLRVIGGREQIPEIVIKYEIQKIVIAIPSASRSEIAKIIHICKNTNAKIKILPRVSDLITSKVSISMIREVSVEDLLGRDPVKVDLEGIANYVTNRVVLVTGAGGSIGSELCRQVSLFNPRRLLLLGRGENSIYEIEMELRQKHPDLTLETIIADIQDLPRIREVFEIHRPSVVFHAAAHKHVPLMERNPAEAVKNNIRGTKNLADCTSEFGASYFVMISTDKAVNPTSVMGVSKRVAEMYVQGLGKMSRTKFVVVRFGNVLGSRGSVIPLFKRQIQEGGPVTITHPEMVRYFMTIPEAAQLVIQAGAFAQGGEIFVLDMGKPVKIVDLAKDLIRLSGLRLDDDIKINYTGIRPGEKLYEEILTNEEGMSVTKHNRIFVSFSNDVQWEKIQYIIKKMEYTVKKPDVANRSDEIKNLLQEIVPSYRRVALVPDLENFKWDEERKDWSEREVQETRRTMAEAASTV